MDARLIETIYGNIGNGNAEAIKDCFDAIVEYGNKDLEPRKRNRGYDVVTDRLAGAYEWAKKLRQKCIEVMRTTDDKQTVYETYEKTLLYLAPNDFDSYMQYMEIDREPSERFYMPRRKILKQLVDALQELADDKLDELFISQPPRTGKTTLLMFFVTWIIGREPERSNLYSAFSDIITSAFYSGILEVLKDPYTYKWNKVFPGQVLVETNAKDETLNIDRRRRYPSLTCRSLYGTLNGACDCNGFLISDDLIGGIEEALNKDRMISAWTKVDNNLLTRAKSKAKILWNGTRWSVIDPAGIRMELLINDDTYKNRRYKIINLPAMDENDESNFDYDYGVGYSTDDFKQKRASFERNNDMASWFAQFMGQPIERDGALFTPDDMRYFNGVLPDGEPDRVFAPVDPAFGGGDFVASPVCYQYGDDVFVVDTVYSDLDKTHTQRELANKIEKWGIKAVRVEANKSTESYATELEQILKGRGIRINLTTKAAPTNVSKNQRIFDKAPDIREHFIFLESGKRSKEYEMFMQNVFSFKVVVKGNKQHDDAPDSLSMAADMVLRNDRVEIFKRPW